MKYMKKLSLLIITLFIGFSCLAQKTYFTTTPPGSSALTTLSWRYGVITPDSLNKLYLYWNGKYNQIYSGTQIQALYYPKTHIDSLIAGLISLPYLPVNNPEFKGLLSSINQTPINNNWLNPLTSVFFASSHDSNEITLQSGIGSAGINLIDSSQSQNNREMSWMFVDGVMTARSHNDNTIKKRDLFTLDTLGNGRFLSNIFQNGNQVETTNNKVTTLDNSTTHYPSTSAITTSLNNYVKITGDNSTGQQNIVGNKYTLTYTSPVQNVHQGVTFGGGYIWLITSAKIYKCDNSYNKLDSVSYSTGGNHMGGGKWDNGKLYVSFEQLTGAIFSGQKILIFDALSAGIPLLTSYDISAQNAENSGLTVNVDTISTISFIDGSKVWKYNKNTGAFIGTIALDKYMYSLNGIGYYNNKYYYFADNGIWTSDLNGHNFVMQYFGTNSFVPYNPTGVFESGDIVSGEIRTLIDPSNGGVNNGGVTASYVKYFTPAGVIPVVAESPSGDLTAYGDLQIGEPSRFPNIYSPEKLSSRNFLKQWTEDGNGAPPLAVYHNNNITGWIRNAYFDNPSNVWRFADSSKYAFRMGFSGSGVYEFKMAAPTNTSAALNWTGVMQIAPTAIYPGSDAAINLGFSSTRFLDGNFSGTVYAGNFAAPVITNRFQLVGSTYLSGITQSAGTGDYNAFDSQVLWARRFDTTTSLWAKVARNSAGFAIDVGGGTGTTSAGSLRHSLFLSNAGRLGENTQTPTSYHTFTAGDATAPSMNIPVATGTSGTVDGGIDRPSTDVLTFQGTSKYKFMFADLSATPSVGSIPYGSGTTSHAYLSPNTAANTKVLTQTGTGSVGQAPVWINIFDTNNIWTQAQTSNRSNGANVTDAWFFQNPTSATGSTIQYSPSLHYQGNGWNTGGSNSYNVDFREYIIPNNTGTSGGKFIWDKSINGGAYSQVGSLDDLGNFVVTGNITGATGVFTGTQVGGNSYNSGTWLVGRTTSTPINASAPYYASVTPKSEIITASAASASYSELVNIWHNGTATGAGTRAVGLRLGLSDQASLSESNKSVIFSLESTSSFAGSPDLYYIIGGVKQYKFGYSGLFTTPTLALSGLSAGASGDTVLTIKNNQVNRTVLTSGTVTSVGTGYGLTGGTITSTGTIVADTSSATGLVSKSRAVASFALKANIASPAFTGTPTAPTQTTGDNSTALATTAYVRSLTLDKFSSTTAANLQGVITGTTGSANLVFAFQPFITTPDITSGANFRANTHTVNVQPVSGLTTNRNQALQDKDGTIALTSDIRLVSYTVATLPASPTTGDQAAVTDATTPTYLGTLTGGGSTYTPVVYNGTAWVAH